MIRFRKWREHNSRAIKDVAAKRETRGVPCDRPLSMQRVLVVTHFDEHFARFAEAVGGGMAETHFLRAIQYAAEHDGLLGSIRVHRDRFGPVVLTRPWHMVGKTPGQRVYDALLESSICVPIDAGTSAPVSADKSTDKSEDKSADRSVDLSLPPSPSPSPSPPPKPPDGGSVASLPEDAPLSPAETAGLKAGAAALQQPGQPDATRSVAAKVLAALADGSLTTRQARKCLNGLVLPNTDARCAYLAAYRAERDRRSA